MVESSIIYISHRLDRHTANALCSVEIAPRANEEEGIKKKCGADNRSDDKTLAAIHALAPAPRVYPSSHAMEDCCAICAEPLTHVAYGPCGHKDACVECVARLRFVLDDRRCVICQVSCERVFATRHMGEYTETIGADGFEALPKKARAGQLHHDEKLDMFFDDDAVCGKVKALRSLVCGECVRDAGGDAGVVTQHSSVKALKAHMREKHGKFFCEVCLEGRKVFLSEQVLYTRAQLDKHRYGASADVDNAFGQSGFKGHPSCKYCRKFFYDEGQLYTHMQQVHETCHMCRRVNPDKHVYYRDYEELERHFRKDHHACLHPDCLAKKFVVFTSPQELKNHEGLEHGRAMTKAERQAALRIDVGFTVGIGEDGRGQGGGHQGGNVGGGRGGGSPADVERMRAQARAHAQEQLRRAQMNSVESAQLEHVLRASAQTETELPRVASVEDFPDLAQGPSRGGLIAGGWAGRAGSGRSSPGTSRGGSAGRDLQDTEAFPSLGGANQPQRQPRHLQPRGGNPAGSSKVPAAVPTRAAEVLAARLRGLSSSDTSFAAASRQASSGGGAMASATIRAPSLAATHDNFPSLGGGSARAPAPAAGGFGAPPGFAQDGEAVAQPKPPPAKQVTIGGGFKQVGKKAKGQWSMGGGSHASASAPTPAPHQPPSKKAQLKTQADERAVEAAAADIAARSDALVTRVRQILDANAKPGATFNAFAALSSQFKNGQCTAPSYVAKLKVMGLDLTIIDELAALMPDGDKRTALEKASAAAARLSGGGGMGGGSRGPGVDSVDAAAAILFGGSRRDENDLDCPACTFHNGGSNVRCDVCDGLRPGAAVGPVVGAAAGVRDGGSAGGGGGGGGKRGGKIKKGKTVSLTAVGRSGVGGIDDLVDPGRSSRSAWGA